MVYESVRFFLSKSWISYGNYGRFKYHTKGRMPEKRAIRELFLSDWRKNKKVYKRFKGRGTFLKTRKLWYDQVLSDFGAIQTLASPYGNYLRFYSSGYGKMAVCSQHGRRIPRGANAEFLLSAGTFCETNVEMNMDLRKVVLSIQTAIEHILL